MKKRDILASIILILTIMTGAIFMTMVFKPLFTWQLEAIDTQYLLGLTHEQVVHNYDELLNYLLNPFVSVLKMSDIPTSPSGAFHFYEVKNLFLLNNVVFLGGVVASIGALRYIAKQQRWQVFAQIGKIITFLPVAVVIIIATSFNYWFVVFHQVAFGNNDWLFDPSTDPIIHVLPETFFLSCAVLIFAIMELCFIVWWQYARYEEKQLYH
ncbi:TIGR01906 family membrane protein [Carnobacteriaceae bacterium zg-ZUI252]|nr:TIGR01906 family membrane protein [Carnobacteriaceae bacterium zg-ZUI252]